MRDLIRRTFNWSELDSERRNAVLLVGGISLVVLIALVVIAYGYYTDRIASSNDTIVEVAGRKFDYDYIERRLLIEVTSSDLASDNAFSLLVAQIMSNVEREELIRQIGKAQGIEISDAEMDEAIREDLNLQEGVSREIVASALSSKLIRRDLTLGEYKDQLKASLIEDKLREQFKAAIPAETEQVDIRLLEVATEAQALELKDRLDAGEEMGPIVATESIHPSKSSAGEFGWIPRGALPPEIDDEVFAQEVGTISPVIEQPDGFYIIHLRGREVRAVDDNATQKVVDNQMSLTLDSMREESNVEFNLTQNQIVSLAAKAQAKVLGGG